jgi:hypothetical protein
MLLSSRSLLLGCRSFLLRGRLMLGDGLLYWSLLLGCRAFLLRGLLMLQWCRLVLGDRLLLYWSLLLGCRAFLLRGLLMLR